MEEKQVLPQGWRVIKLIFGRKIKFCRRDGESKDLRVGRRSKFCQRDGAPADWRVRKTSKFCQQT